MDKTILETQPGVSAELLEQINRGYEISQALFTGVDYGIFDLLEKPQDAERISQELETDPSLTRKLLDVLSAMQVLSKDGPKYHNTRLASVFLVKESPFYQGELIQLRAGRYDDWGKLKEILRTGAKAPDPIERNNVFGRDFTCAMAQGALRGSLHRTVERISALPEFKGAKTLLDLGDGHGLYAIALCQLNPGLCATIFDLPNVVETTKEYIAQFGMKKRIEILSGDFNRDDIGEGYDMLLASDVLYRDREHLVLRRIHKALSENGLAILKHWTVNGNGGAITSALFDLGLSLRGGDHTMYTTADYATLLQDNGFSSVRIFDISASWSPSAIVVGIKQ